MSPSSRSSLHACVHIYLYSSVIMQRIRLQAYHNGVLTVTGFDRILALTCIPYHKNGCPLKGNIVCHKPSDSESSKEREATQYYLYTISYAQVLSPFYYLYVLMLRNFLPFLIAPFYIYKNRPLLHTSCGKMSSFRFIYKK